jgi:DnaD/phage-associated family protein
MYALGLGKRRAVETEERYIRSWIDMGFTVDAVALAYDKTVIYKKELNWRYLNGILRRWHEKGWHTAEEINRGDAQPKKAKNPADDGMDKYLDW